MKTRSANWRTSQPWSAALRHTLARSELWGIAVGIRQAKVRAYVGLSPRYLGYEEAMDPPTPFEAWGERAYEGASQRQLLAALIVSVGALALTLCVALLMLFSGETLEPLDQNRFPIPACLISFAAWRGICLRPCTHKSRLVSAGWSRSALP